MTPTLTPAQARIASRALMPQLQILGGLLEDQVRLLPAGCDDWTKTDDELQAVIGTLNTLSQLEHQ
jgi:hypothetical protein